MSYQFKLVGFYMQNYGPNVFKNFIAACDQLLSVRLNHWLNIQYFGGFVETPEGESLPMSCDVMVSF